ncbi:hypothetical protein [Brevibacillus porteri]|uniref:hypothetical protein n=1 Tax=Brevibacillus porteri TaxID=2126350 RepID=UPI00363F8F12
MCLELDEEFRKQNDGHWIDRNRLQSETKKCIDLHAKGIHHVVHKYLFSRDGTYKAIKEGRSDMNLPHRKKKYYVTGWDYQSIKIDYFKGVIKLSKPDYIDINGKNKRASPIKCYAKNIPKNIVVIELLFRGKLYLAIKYIEEDQYMQVNSDNAASIDLGEIHSITSIDSNANAIIITGRKLRSIKQLRNKNAIGHSP